MNDILLFVVLPLMWLGTGWKLCQSRHRQKGMEVDKFWDRPDPLLGLDGPQPDWDRELQDMNR